MLPCMSGAPALLLFSGMRASCDDILQRNTDGMFDASYNSATGAGLAELTGVVSFNGSIHGSQKRALSQVAKRIYIKRKLR